MISAACARAGCTQPAGYGRSLCPGHDAGNQSALNNVTHQPQCCCSACWQQKQNGFGSLHPEMEKQDVLIERHAQIIQEATRVPDDANPDYYNRGGIASADIIDAWQLGPWEANALKYLLRAKFKGNEAKDLKKAAWCIERARKVTK